MSRETPDTIKFGDSANHQLLRTRVYEYLREQIRNESMQPGMYISMNQLTKTLDISRTPLRDALLQLQTEGFLTFLPQRGIKINELTWEEIVNLYEILGGLDSRALLSVFDRLGPREIKKMRAVNEKMYAVDCSGGYGDYFNMNTAFHNVYLDLSTNRELTNYLNIIRQRLFQFAKRDWGKVCEMNYQEHLTMLELIEQGRDKEAADFMRDVHCTINWV